MIDVLRKTTTFGKPFIFVVFVFFKILSERDMTCQAGPTHREGQPGSQTAFQSVIQTARSPHGEAVFESQCNQSSIEGAILVAFGTDTLVSEPSTMLHESITVKIVYDLLKPMLKPLENQSKTNGFH